MAAKLTCSRTTLIAGVLAGVVLVSGLATLAVVSQGHPRETTVLAHQRPSKLPPAPPGTITAATARDGSAVVCPVGSEPEADITDASLSPRLPDGVTIGVGTYRITLHGRLLNETSAPITVTTVAVVVNGQPWAAKVTTASSLPAQGSASFLAEGTYASPRSQAVAINTEVEWSWQSPSLRPCGDHGLIHEH
jgi:hypothetical protein